MKSSPLQLLLTLILGVLIGSGAVYFLKQGSSPTSHASGGLGPGSGAGLGPPEGGELSGPTGASILRELPKVAPVGLQEPKVQDAEVRDLVQGLEVSKVQSAKGSGVIQGFVVDSEGNPLPGVSLRIRKLSGLGYFVGSSTRGGALPKRKTLEEVVRRAAENHYKGLANTRDVLTDSSGAYRFVDLADARWTLQAFCEGYELKPNKPVRDLAIGMDVNFEASRLIEVSLEVYLPSGELANEAVLLVTPPGETRPERLGWKPEEAFLRVTPGAYKINAIGGEIYNYVSSELTSEEQELQFGFEEKPSTLRFDLVPRLGIRGQVGLAEGDPVPDRMMVKMLALAPEQEIDLELLSKSREAASVTPGSEYSFQDLEPGRYVVGLARGHNHPIGAHMEVQVSTKTESCDLILPPIDRDRVLRVMVLDDQGDQAEGVTFSFESEINGRARSRRIDSIRDADRAYLLNVPAAHFEDYFGSQATETQYSLEVNHKELGKQVVALAAGQTDITATFVSPGALTVTILAYQGSGMEGRVSLGLTPITDTPGAFYYPTRDSKLKPNGTQTFQGLAPGAYKVSLTVTPKGQDGMMVYSDNSVQSIEVQVRSGDNQAQITLPALYDLNVAFPDGKEGDRMSLQAKNGGRIPNFRMAQLGADRYARWKDIPAGEYTLGMLTGRRGHMEITIPCGEIEFIPMKVNAFSVNITDPNGTLAQAGLQSGDLIIGQNGEEFSVTADSIPLQNLIRSKAIKLNLIVLRGSKRLEFPVTGGKEVFGATLEPTKR